MADEIQDLKDRHKGDILTLWKIYESDNSFYNNFYFKASLLTSIFLAILAFVFKVDIYELIKTTCEISLNILPNLLGFNLGAYILIVGFGSTDILAVITKPLKAHNNYSFYQKLNGVLGISVIVQILTLFVTFLFRIWDSIQVKFIYNSISDKLVMIINIVSLLFIFLLVIYSFLLLINVVKHVFMFAQTIHLCIYKNELDKRNTNNENE